MSDILINNLSLLKKIFNDNEIIIDNILFEKKYNVKTIIAEHNYKKKFEYYEDELEENNENNPIKKYFLIESPNDAAFAHWFYDSSLFILYQKYFPEYKILLKKSPERKYKKSILKMLNIDEKDIEFYSDNIIYDTHYYYEIPKNNICIIPSYILFTQLSFDKSLENTFIFKINNFLNYINDNYNISYNKTINKLFFPRSKKENYIQNDRTVIYEGFKDFFKNNDYIEYDTINTENFIDQIRLLASAKNIFLDWGSNFAVNTLFCKDSNIYCIITDFQKKERDELYTYKILLNMIKNNNNNVYYINN